MAMAMMAAGGLFQAFSQYQQGKAQAANAKYNAALAKNQAEQGRMEAVENFKRAKRNSEQQLSKARAAAAASGTVISQGSTLDVMGDISKELELEIQDNYRAAQVQRGNLLAKSAQYKQQAKDAKRAGKLMAIGTLFKTGSQMAFNQQLAGNTRLMDFERSSPTSTY